MKIKAISTIICLLMVASFVFAEDLSTVISNENLSTKLSTGVSGVYQADATDNATGYVLYTAHNDGTKIYATGNFVTKIFQKDDSNPVTNLPTDEPGDYDNATESFFTDLGFE